LDQSRQSGECPDGEGHTSAEFLAGARRYAAFCEATGSLGSQFVKQACTFLGPDKPFLLPWHAPPKPETASERILRTLNDNSRVIEHEPERIPRALRANEIWTRFVGMLAAQRSSASTD